MAKHKAEHHSGHMKPHHKAAMERSHSSHARSHFATGLGVSEAEHAAIGHGEFANMPKEVHMEMYPKSKNYRGGVLNDTITGIDQVSGISEGKASKFMSHQH